MNLLNMQVEHESFDRGYVVEYTDTILEVCFKSGNKKFAFPDALGTHLILVDQKTADLAESMKQEIYQERMKKEQGRERLKNIECEARQRSIKREKLLKNYKISPASQAGFWCDEQEHEQVFSEWRVSTGQIKSGPNEGKPNRLIRLHQNSACLITARTPDMPEEERSIKGAFMVNETFIGRLCETGYIPAHSKYNLHLSEEESKKMLFWNYYVNERSPSSMTWNSGKYRYFNNVWMAQILQAIVAMKKGSDDQALAQSFLQHFCEMNQIAEKDLPKPNGALVRMGA